MEWGGERAGARESRSGRVFLLPFCCYMYIIACSLTIACIIFYSLPISNNQFLKHHAYNLLFLYLALLVRILLLYYTRY